MAYNTVEDGLKWFGEGFDGFPRQTSENYVDYVLVIISPKQKPTDKLADQLMAVYEASLDVTEKLLGDYIWQRENFKLRIDEEKTYIHGRTNYGDSVEDEWLVVYLLRELSRQFPDLWIQLSDNDGQFLLIEAASTLPRWLNPEVADNRIWINRGRLLIVPLFRDPVTKLKPTKPIPPLNVADAMTIIRDMPEVLIHSPFVENEAFYRLRNYPAQIPLNLHHAIITIPANLASILHSQPALISSAIEAFYLRDPISLRPFQESTKKSQRKSSPPPLLFPPTSLVTTSVTFSKVGYAQLKSQRFPAPGPWAHALPPTTDDEPNPTTAYRRAETGMKVACAFEMLVADPANSTSPAVTKVRQLSDSLARGETPLPTQETISASWPQTDDSEAWLDIDFASFESELAGSAAGTAKTGTSEKDGFGDAATQENLRKVVARFESFLNDEGAGLEGAEGLDDMDFDDDEDEEEVEEDSEGEDKDVSFDEEEFARMMREMMGMPGGAAASAANRGGGKVEGLTPDKKEGEDDSDEESDGSDGSSAAEIQDLMQRMESELNAAGALDLDPTPRKIAAVQGRKGKGKGKGKGKEKETAGTASATPQEKKHSVRRLDDDEDDSEDSEGEGSQADGDLDIDYNLAKNLLESFKSQGGMAGPVGNLMGMMGLQMPRDEDEEEHGGGGGGGSKRA